MTVTLDLPPDLESRLRDRAAAEGVDPGALVVRVLRQSQELSVAPPPTGEAELLQRINLGFTEAFWERYHILAERLEAEQMSAAERDEFIGMTDQVEAANARRIQAVGELARVRGTTFDVLMDDLGLRHKARGE